MTNIKRSKLKAIEEMQNILRNSEFTGYQYSEIYDFLTDRAIEILKTEK